MDERAYQMQMQAKASVMKGIIEILWNKKL